MNKEKELIVMNICHVCLMNEADLDTEICEDCFEEMCNRMEKEDRIDNAAHYDSTRYEDNNTRIPVGIDGTVIPDGSISMDEYKDERASLDFISPDIARELDLLYQSRARTLKKLEQISLLLNTATKTVV